MTANKLIRNPLWATLLAALVATMVVSYFVFVQSGEAAQVADKPTYEPLIVNGTLVPDGKYPFMAFLYYTYPNGGDSWCGGSLIDKDSVLTAAHCVVGHPKNWKLQVYVGRTALSSNKGQMRSWKSIWYHAGYKPKKSKNQANDAAVINLSSAVSGIKPIELATSSQNKLESPGSRATVTGWGATFPEPPGGDNPRFRVDRMREAQVPIFTDAIGQHSYSKGYVPPLMIAAGGYKNGQDSCHGDSGGPLFRQASGKYTQIGIVSHALGCAAGYPGVYTEVNNPSIRGFITRYAAK
jgi:secreted trypsin-like serine protease